MRTLDEPTAVYRFFDAAGSLLYVGIAVDPKSRWSTHSWSKPWWAEVSRKTVEWHANRAAAMAAEMELIKSQAPRYNIVGTPEHAERVRQGQANPHVRARRELRRALADQHPTVSGSRLIVMISKAARASGLAFEMLRQHGSHQVWRCGRTNVVITQNNKVPEDVAQQTMEALESELGKDWWR